MTEGYRHCVATGAIMSDPVGTEMIGPEQKQDQHGERTDDDDKSFGSVFCHAKRDVATNKRVRPVWFSNRKGRATESRWRALFSEPLLAGFGKRPGLTILK
jgi:hypothetical protein